MTKTLGKVIMKRSQLQNSYFKKTTTINELVRKNKGIFAADFIKKKRSTTTTIKT